MELNHLLDVDFAILKLSCLIRCKFYRAKMQSLVQVEQVFL